MIANLYLGRTYMAQSECSEAVRHCEAAIALIPESQAQERFGQAALPRAFARATRLPPRSRRSVGSTRRSGASATLRIAEEAGHVYSLLYPLFGFGILRLDQRDFVGAVAPLECGFRALPDQRGSRAAP